VIKLEFKNKMYFFLFNIFIKSISSPFLLHNELKGKLVEPNENCYVAKVVGIVSGKHVPEDCLANPWICIFSVITNPDF
jgi:hypothetical protein